MSSLNQIVANNIIKGFGPDHKVKTHTRKTKSGKMVIVTEHQAKSKGKKGVAKTSIKEKQGDKSWDGILGNMKTSEMENKMPNNVSEYAAGRGEYDKYKKDPSSKEFKEAEKVYRNSLIKQMKYRNIDKPKKVAKPLEKEPERKKGEPIKTLKAQNFTLKTFGKDDWNGFSGAEAPSDKQEPLIAYENTGGFKSSNLAKKGKSFVDTEVVIIVDKNGLTVINDSIKNGSLTWYKDTTFEEATKLASKLKSPINMKQLENFDLQNNVY